MTESVAERYLRLGLQVGRHADGVVDAYFGPPELAAEVESAPPVEPRTLVAGAEALLDELEDGWLRDQVSACAPTSACWRESRSYADEVEGCYGVRPTYTDEAVFTAAHERLEELLPGDGLAGGACDRWEESIRVAPERIERTLAAVVEEARAWARGLVEPPDGEGVVLEIVRTSPGGRPATTSATCEPGRRQRRPADVGVELLVLAIHETYPGHHTERCCKEHLLVRGRGLLEEAFVLSPTPQSLVSEGIACSPRAARARRRGGARGDRRDAVIELDLAHALAVERALEPCRWARSTRR